MTLSRNLNRAMKTVTIKKNGVNLKSLINRGKFSLLFLSSLLCIVMLILSCDTKCKRCKNTGFSQFGGYCYCPKGREKKQAFDNIKTDGLLQQAVKNTHSKNKEAGGNNTNSSVLNEADMALVEAGKSNNDWVSQEGGVSWTRTNKDGSFDIKTICWNCKRAGCTYCYNAGYTFMHIDAVPVAPTSRNYNNDENSPSDNRQSSVSCNYCKGTGIDPYPTHAPDYTGKQKTQEYCNICNAYKDPHYHKKCLSCK